ncbi:hypothetical protein N9N67_04130 [Bacteriovoracaceae bacterium]|nr:hypothetical protein [Bacteriovoracaceae bacterium]
MSKSNRRDFLQQLLKLGILSPAYIKLFEQTLLQNALGQSNSNHPKFLFIVYGEGQCNQMANQAKRSLFTSSGNLINGNSSQLTSGMSGIAGIEQFSTIIQNVGVSHEKMWPHGKDATPPFHTNRLGIGTGNLSSDHRIFNVSVLNGMHHCQNSIDMVMKTLYGKKRASFCSSPFVEDYDAPSYSMSVTDTIATGCSMQVPGFNFITPDLSLDSLYNNIIGFGSGGNTNNTAGSNAKKNMLSQLLPIIENVKGRVPGHAQDSMNTYLELVTNYRDSLQSSGGGSGGGGNQNNCNLGTAPDPVNGDSIGTGLKAAELMMKSMACSALDVGSLCFFPTNGSGGIYPGFSGGGGNYTYNGSIENLDQFINQNVSHPNDFIKKMAVDPKGNHHCSHYKGNLPSESGYWRDEWQHESLMVNDYTNTNIHKRIFDMARNITTGSGNKLSEELIVVTMYAQGHADPHYTKNCPIILSTEGDFIQKNKIKVYSGSDIEVAADPSDLGQGQAIRRSEFLQALLKLIDPNTPKFGDARLDKIPDLKNLV